MYRRINWIFYPTLSMSRVILYTFKLLHNNHYVTGDTNIIVLVKKETLVSCC